jgi:hypothetical protein
MHLLTALLTLALQSTASGFTPEELWQSWPAERFVEAAAPCLRPAALEAELRRLAARSPDDVELEEIGRSFEGRPIHMITLGHGPRKVLLWSQMHGDEPSATPALLDIAHVLLSRADEPAAAAILDGLTLLMIPMLNPDGSEIYERRNSQAIDINRDALHLATPEGRLLKRIRDRYQPMLGFNLHDQNWRMTVGDTGVLATTSVLGVAGDEAGTATPGRLLAKRACSAIVQTLDPFIPGGVARFDEDWNPRAFGDNITAWGTPVVLIESGGLPPGRDITDLTRLNFVAILTVLQELVRNDLADYDPEVYEGLQRNRRDGWADVVVLGGLIRQPQNPSPYRADLAFNLEVDDRDRAGCPTGSAPRSLIVEIGDAGFLGAGRVVDAGGKVITAPFAAGVEGWKARRWLDAAVLEEVARLGVGAVTWQVPPRRAADARALAGELAGGGRARLEVVSTADTLPWLRLTGPPGTPRSGSLADVIEALNGSPLRAQPGEEVLERLFSAADTGGRRPALRRGQPASFVVLAPGDGGALDPATIRIETVFLNGREVAGEPR